MYIPVIIYLQIYYTRYILISHYVNYANYFLDFFLLIISDRLAIRLPVNSLSIQQSHDVCIYLFLFEMYHKVSKSTTINEN